ncbi:asparagine synthase-related protein [Arthrobacter sp. MDT2-2]
MGVLLSGGVDSSLIVALLAELGQEGLTPSASPSTVLAARRVVQSGQGADGVFAGYAYH